jgi:hypothetical protein
MARKRKQSAAQADLLEAKVATAPCVPGIREKVKAWREGGYKGVSDTTSILLNYWFYTDHKLPDDFVVLTSDGTHYIVETKGLEDTNVVNKDRAAQLWCENTTKLSGQPWAYLKVLQTAYKQLQPSQFEDLIVLKQKKLL